MISKLISGEAVNGKAFLGLLCFGLVTCRGERAETEIKQQIPDPGTRPNILWIVGENLALDLGCYGERNVRTPNLDALAEKGIRYTNVYSTSSVSAPSRSCFMTGMYQTSTDTHNMRSHRDDDFRLPPGVRPLTHLLQDAGYFTANISYIGEREVGTGKLDLNFVNEGPIYQSDDWEKLKSSQPFFAQVNMPEAEYDIYDRQSAKKERVEWYGEDTHPQIATPGNVTPPPYYPDHEITRQEWARYLNSVSGMDIRIGWILNRLREDGLDDNTIVIFFADNGRLEARGIHYLWDSGIHVPMIIYWPEKVPMPEGYVPGSVSSEMISLIDLTATTLSVAGILKPPLLQSRIFLGAEKDEPRTYVFSARDRIDETVNRIRSVREKKYHYIRNFIPGEGFTSLNRYQEKCFLVKPLMRKLYNEGKLTGPAADLMKPLPGEMLYDTEADPHEINNLAGSDRPEHIGALIRLRAALDTWIVETGDLGRFPEPPEIVAPFDKEMHDWFGTPEWYRQRQ
ncbi:MAG TPA: sulfatase [Bacteroidales bacterium]|nr:sulfatase [Bacteroidales bacterium]